MQSAFVPAGIARYVKVMSVNQDQDTPAGFAFALTAYVLWGFLPLYMKLLAHIPAPEVILHRVIWSVPIAGLVLLLLMARIDPARVESAHH